MKWISEVSLFIYKRNLIGILLVIVLSVPIWGALSLIFSKGKRRLYIWKTMNWGMFLLATVAILYITLFSRNVSKEYELCIIPFCSFYLAKKNVEIYRTMLMNVLLFLPLGLSYPNIMYQSKRQVVLNGIWGMMILSIIIEILQLFFGLGRAEVDDVLCNTIGGFIGLSAYIISNKIQTNVELKKG